MLCYREERQREARDELLQRTLQCSCIGRGRKLVGCASKPQSARLGLSFDYPTLAAMGTHGKRANRSFTEVFSFDPESVIETRAVVLPGNRRCELDQLGFVEFFTQPHEQRVRHFHWSLRDAIGVFKDEAFQGREI